MKSLVKKKSVIAYALTGLLTLSLSLLSLNVNAEKTAFANAEQNYYVMDADQLSFEGKVDLPQKDSMNLFMSGTDNTMIQTSVSKSSPSVKLIASAYGDRIYGGDNDAIKVEVKLLFNRWEGEGMFSQDASFITLNAYNSADTSFENPIATLEEYGVLGNFVRTVQFAPEEICNSRGKLQDIVFPLV